MDVETIIDVVRAHAHAEFPREACGLVIGEAGRPVYVPCRNTAEGVAHFVMEPRDIVAALARGSLLAVVHSHPNASPEPSQADMVMAEQWGVPWLIVNVPVGHYAVHRPNGYHPPLVGRTYSHGVLDCFSLIRDYYKEVLAVVLPDFDRAENWWDKGGNLYLDHYQSAGFVDVTGQPLREHDVVLMQLRSPVPNHGAVYLGKDVILHHLIKHLSRRETYSGFWSKITNKVVRHRTQC